MGQTKGDVLSGTLDLLVLKTLARDPMHGYGITLHIQRRDGCMFCSRAESDTRGPASSTPARMSALLRDSFEAQCFKLAVALHFIVFRERN